MGSRIKIGSIENGSLLSTSGGYEATQPLQKDFLLMNIIAPDLYWSLRHTIERRRHKSRIPLKSAGAESCFFCMMVSRPVRSPGTLRAIVP